MESLRRHEGVNQHMGPTRPTASQCFGARECERSVCEEIEPWARQPGCRAPYFVLITPEEGIHLQPTRSQQSLVRAGFSERNRRPYYYYSSILFAHMSDSLGRSRSDDRPFTRREYLAVVAGVGFGTAAGASGQTSAQSSSTIQLNVGGYASTGIPPLTTANFQIDTSALEVDAVADAESLQIQFRNLTTDEELVVDPQQDITDTLVRDDPRFGLKDIRLTMFDPTGEIAAEPTIDLDLDSVPVDVSGDTTLLRTDTVVDTYQAAIRGQGGLRFETPPQQIGTQRPDGFVQTDAGDTLRYEIAQRGLQEFPPKLELIEVLANEDNNTITGTITSEGTDFVATLDPAEFTEDADVEFRSLRLRFYPDEAAAEADRDESVVFEPSPPGVTREPESLSGALSADVDVAETDVAAGESVNITYTVTNIGDTDSGRLRETDLWTVPETGEIPDEAQASNDLPVLAPGESADGSFSYTTSEADTGSLTLLISPGNSGERKVGVATVTVGDGDDASGETEHESGVSEELFEAVDENGDGELSRNETKGVVEAFIRDGELDRVAVERTDVRSLVEYFIRQ